MALEVLYLLSVAHVVKYDSGGDISTTCIIVLSDLLFFIVVFFPTCPFL